MAEQVFGEDVEHGDEIGPLVKRPTLEQVQAFLNAWGRHEGNTPDIGRFTATAAASRDGLAGPIVPGPLSLAFLSQLLTDWAGPAGRLQSLDVNFRRPTRQNEELRCIGLITDKREQGAETAVHFDVYIEDSNGDRPTQGVAEVIIPTAR